MRKKWLGISGVFILAFTLATAAWAAGPIKLYVNGREIQVDVPPQLINGRTMVPVRWVAEALGADVEWDEAAQTVRIATKAKELEEQARGRYYPRVPEEITTPEMALQAYFDALYYAANLTPAQMGAAGGTVGMDKEPYPVAYNYWSQEWRAEHSYEQFLASWQGTANVELLKLFPAGEENGAARFFVETKHLEVVEGKPGPGVFYYSGFFTVGKTTEGWRLTGGSLEPENLARGLGGHQPWREDPRQVAAVELREQLGDKINLDPAATQVTTLDDGQVVVMVPTTGEKPEWYKVILVPLTDRTWQVLSWQQGGAN
ncbi:MAG: copper amine oxidase N-terminal domain-containing protein [Clostridia bacterium]|nr:MAG: copper amine oxidase N-terminal domain-containing protein [Clostridia bacterium]